MWETIICVLLTAATGAVGTVVVSVVRKFQNHDHRIAVLETQRIEDVDEAKDTRETILRLDSKVDAILLALAIPQPPPSPKKE